ncbi:DUF3526 domain-containing protein [Aquincola sp. S2]|uniref:DUF3526 domain-containing protein n=1 Tax=Pseudaquabacterium terrae TaxID=2732868 RepID=A0ABX2EEQ6_9BURK|nr:DUF3526 domain-containing protein [Aquabacterium terrae]NRF67089.1 DUF3526 domain-containing protein [Aquabacterium terrae]
MIRALLIKELRLLWRHRTAGWLALTLLVAVPAAALLAVQRVERFEFERHSAQAADRVLWDAQGVRNPHAAAHFSRYAFKSMSPLAAFDPGVVDHAGLAVWMEAHQQSPPVYRRAEDQAADLRLAALTPAWLLQVVAPLLLLIALHPAIAGEREDGTFRHLAAAGAGTAAVVAGKLGAAVAALAVVLLPAVAAALVVAASCAHTPALPDLALRSAGLLLAYGGGLLIFALVSLGVSALCRQRRTALLALMVLWLATAIVVPRLGTDLALERHPEPDAQTFRTALAASADSLWSDRAFQSRQLAQVLVRHGVERAQDLPFNYLGLQLQLSEERAQPRFDAFYASMSARHAAQESVLARVAWASPGLALGVLSSGLAASDRLHHTAFVRDAELQRRRIMKQLNADIQAHAGHDGTGYTADERLWRAVADFQHTPVPFTLAQAPYAETALTLLVQLIAALAFAWFAVARAHLRSIAE